MQETIITFETAKLANQKGLPKLNTPHGYSIDGKYADDIYFGKIEYEAPTQSILQKFLREVHNIHIVIEHDSDNYYYVIQGLNDVNIKTIDSSEHGNVYKNYEDCLEISLQEALKLI